MERSRGGRRGGRSDEQGGEVTQDGVRPYNSAPPTRPRHWARSGREVGAGNDQAFAGDAWGRWARGNSDGRGGEVGVVSRAAMRREQR
jgi:hypothetical protein